MINKIHWRITDICNFKCYYCFHKEKKRSNIIIDNEKIKNACEFLKDFVDKNLSISIVGGEPTVDENIKDKLKTIKKILNPKEISISTNGYDIKNISKDIFINYSIHLDYINKEKILNDLKYLNKNKHKIMIMISRELTQDEVSLFKMIRLMKYRCEYYKILIDDSLVSFNSINYNENFEYVKGKKECHNKDKLVISIDGRCKRKLCNSGLYMNGNLYNNTLDITEDIDKCNEVYCSTWNIS